ncbi:aurkb-a [Symbiodinium natans]|uniref:Aurkb-a protein n=1 Tax=Symbiodinium natans TaxID=878477 RepID=A0A812P0C4_9DINO|nr:aurkb-a [Symbiodinium natans]
MVAIVEDVDDDVCPDVEVTGSSASAGSKRPLAAAPRNTANVCIDDDIEEDVCIQPTKAKRARSAKGTAVTVVESDSDSSSSGSSRSRTLKRRGGAAAAAALLSQSTPLDVDEASRLVSRTLTLPTSFAGPLQHEGGLVVVMAETGANISVQQGASATDTAVSVEGTSEAVGKAAAQIQQLYDEFAEAERKAKLQADCEHMDQVEIPQKLLSAAVGPNGSDLPKVRDRCGGVMIALMPPSAGGHLTAFIGPGTAEQVQQAKEELLGRVQRAEAGEVPAQEPAPRPKLADEFEALMADVDGK